MIRTFCKLVVWFALTGCTVNNFQPDSFSAAYKISYRENARVEPVHPVPIVTATVVPQVPVVTIIGNAHIRAECAPYSPLVMPEPAKIDFKKLQAAPNSVGINAVILENVKELRQQMISYGEQQKKHYAAYVGRCVVK